VKILTKIDSSFYLDNQSIERNPSSALGKDEFLKILMTQLQHQDPLSPMDDREFISQMATFSTLEQTMNMAESIETLVQGQYISPVIQYSHMIGKEVTYETDEETGDKKEIENSKVIAVSQQNERAVLELENGDKVYADSILKISESPNEETNISKDINSSMIKGSE